MTLAVAIGIATAQTDQSQQPAPTADQTQAQSPDQNSEQSASTRYEGPSILSRDRSLIGERSGKLLDYRFYANLTGTYDSQFIPVSTTTTGGLNVASNLYGLQFGYGVTGSRSWAHDKLSVDYSGDFRHYPNATFFDGTDQFLNLSYSHQFSRRFSIQARETAGISSYSNGYFTYLPLQNTDLYAVPTNELFDNRTDFLESRLDGIYQLTRRLSVDIGGEGFFVRRRSISLASVNGGNAHADIAYRLTRRQTVSLNYQYTQFSYLREFGDANFQELGVGYSIGLGRRWDLATMVGEARANFTGLTVVNLDPAVAAIVGQNTAVVSFNTVSYIPVYSARLIRRLERASVILTGEQSFSPGNGVYLASRQTAATVSYSYTGMRKLSVGAQTGYIRLSSLGQNLGAFAGLSAGVGATYKLASYSHLEVRYDFRHYSANNAFYRQNDHHVEVGIAFSPGERPLPIW